MSKQKEIKRAYSVTDGDELYVAVVAKNATEAKTVAFHYFGTNMFDVEWVDLVVTWKKGVNVDDLPYGFVEAFVGLKLGLYGSLEGEDCPRCTRNDTILYYDESMGGFYCNICQDESEEEDCDN